MNYDLPFVGVIVISTAALVSAAISLPCLAADDEPAASSAVKRNFTDYARETSVPVVPAAALLGVDKSKIVEVSSISALSATLTSARSASETGTPFGIDLSPALLMSDKGGWMAGQVQADDYASNYRARLLFRTRLSVASATKDNSQMSAWGLYTRPIDLRDPFIDRGLERCFQEFNFKPAPRMLPLPSGKLSSEDANNLKNGLLQIVQAKNPSAQLPPSTERAIDAAIGKDTQGTTPEAVELRRVLKQYADEVGASAEAEPARLKDAQSVYAKCSANTLNHLQKHSYLAIGYSKGSSQAVDDAKSIETRPGQSLWLTFVYGFEGLANVFGGEQRWRDGNSPEGSSWFEQNARLTLHLARHLGGSQLVSGVENNTSGRLFGIGFDVADGDSRRFSFQATDSRPDDRANLKSERTVVVGVDFKVQDSTWLGLSWGRQSQQTGGSDNEVKAQLKWAFSRTGWL